MVKDEDLIDHLEEYLNVYVDLFLPFHKHLSSSPHEHTVVGKYLGSFYFGSP